ncbi:succinic semialdehyde dehydrogenase [Streptoalloteichus hindustanus]|uniref:Succinate-semialdehyde dehydrogenase / glutarate-semialdehyde dehydrogenase n=1 Tax=Streptoalloteichus hindustanus TaxID=2017 RepID=A0A1M5GCM7_STRHI|nr:succinic semialdehyde dehydrogenase [Streptoalloteichus hindustanus]SHG01446.1 succinate-semialdehyde dehydrogenase / glutarate-semialdehyde dehydrogenase [Streptoalloteichus hindustanus]
MDETNLPADRARHLLRRVVASGASEPAVAPFTGRPFTDLPQSTPEDVATALGRAAEAQRAWADVPVRDRAAVLLRFHDLVLRCQDEILDLLQLETGKARWHAYEEIAIAAINARYYGRRAPGLLARRRRGGVIPGLTSARELRHPKGVVGLVSPWNYPVALGVSDGLAALVAGNALVHKPDNQGALAVLRCVDLLHEAGLPEGLWQVVLGDGPTVGGAVVDSADYVCFTGSTRTGRTVGRRAGERLVGCSLELGGKNAMLVLDDADVNRAAEGAVRACFSSAGQLCVSIERIYVDRRVHDVFVAAFLRRVRAMRLAPGTDWSVDMGSLVSQRQLDAVRAHVDDAVDKGARVLAGGRHRPDLGPYFFEPTVLADVTPDMACFADETFGPVVAIHPFDHLEEAVAAANATPYGLNASVWSRDRCRGARVAARLRAGSVNVNEGYAASYGSVDVPMGGVGASGVGRRHGADGLLRFTEAQAVVTQHVMGLGRPPGVSYPLLARGYTLMLRALRRIGRA